MNLRFSYKRDPMAIFFPTKKLNQFATNTMGDFQGTITAQLKWWQEDPRHRLFMYKEIINISIQFTLMKTDTDPRTHPNWQIHKPEQAELVSLWNSSCVKCRQPFGPNETQKRIKYTNSAFHFGCAFLATQTVDLYKEHLDRVNLTLLATHPHWYGTYFFKEGSIH